MQDPSTIGLVQIGDCFGGQYYLPYSIGVLQSYAQSKLSAHHRVDFLSPIYFRVEPKIAVKKLEKASIVFFSTYIWNFRLSLEIAKQVKTIHPKTLIVFGGPQVPENPDRLRTFLTEHPYIDMACFGEGEEAFVSVIKHAQTPSWEEIPGVAYIHSSGKMLINPHSPLISDLDTIPSPYLSGVYSSLLSQKSHNWSALLETNRGCPFTCAFCYWGAGERKKIRKYSIDRVNEELNWFSQNKIEFVFCCDANFGILNRDAEIVSKVATCKARSGYPKAFSVQSTKNSTAKIFSLQKQLNEAGLQKGVNLALQSLHPPALEAINRSNISPTVYSELLQLFNKEGISAFSDIILGLPEETYHSFTEGIEKAIAEGQHTRIQFINLTILENSAMADPEYLARFDLDIIESKIVSHHTSLDQESPITETQKLVVGNASMPRKDWEMARVFSWLMSFLYYDRLIQIPLLLLKTHGNVPIKNIIEKFLTADSSRPVIKSISELVSQLATDITKGQPEYFPSAENLNLWWQVDEYLLIRLVRDNTLEKFYSESEKILGELESCVSPTLISEALLVNRNLIKVPFVKNDIDLTLNYPIPEMFHSLKSGTPTELNAGSYQYKVDRSTSHWNSWETWLREVVWYGGKRGDYLYPITRCKRK